MNVAIVGKQAVAKGGITPIESGTQLLDYIRTYGYRDVWANEATIQNIVKATNGLYWKSDSGQSIAEYGGVNGRVFLHDIAMSPWQMQHIDGANAEQLMTWLDRLAESLGVKALQHSPNYRFVSTLAYTKEKFPERFISEQPEIPGNRPRGMGNNWLRPLQRNDANGKTYLHVFDLRAAWLACARTARLGYGKVEFIDAKRAMNCIVHNESGYWVVNPSNPPPHPVPITQPGVYETGVVRAAIKHGQPIVVENGWHWIGQAETLRPTIEQLMKSRARSMGTRDTALRDFMERMHKLMYTRGLGVLERTSKRFPWQYQPHWYYAVQSECVRRVWEKVDCLPGAFAVNLDEIYYTSDEPNPRMNEAFPVDTGQAGSWRYQGSMVVSEELVNATRDTLKNGSALSGWLRERNCLEDMSDGGSW